MSHQMNETQLFVALSKEQQELVTGGAAAAPAKKAADNTPGASRTAMTNYMQAMLAMQGKTSSGPNGSSTQSALLRDQTKTSAVDKMKVSLFDF